MEARARADTQRAFRAEDEEAELNHATTLYSERAVSVWATCLAVAACPAHKNKKKKKEKKQIKMEMYMTFGFNRLH